MPALARSLLHSVHVVTFAVLFVTGFLLFVPSLRETVTGGYSLFIREAHRWGGIAFAVLPVLVIAGAGARQIFAVPPPRTLTTRWQGFHLAATVFMTLAFTLTGAVIWNPRVLPDAIVDLSRSVHNGLTHVAAAFAAAHLCAVGGAAVAARWRVATGD